MQQNVNAPFDLEAAELEQNVNEPFNPEAAELGQIVNEPVQNQHFFSSTKTSQCPSQISRRM